MRVRWAIERAGGVAVAERRVEVALCERGVGGLEMDAEHAALIAPADVARPGRVGLVFEHVAAHERECSLESAARLPSALARRALDELIGAVEVELDQI